MIYKNKETKSQKKKRGKKRRRKLKFRGFCQQNQQTEFPCSFIEMLAVGDLWRFVVKFSAQSRTIANTAAGQPGFHWSTLMRWCHTLERCAVKGLFYKKHSSFFFLSLPFLLKQPVSMTILWSCTPPQICDFDHAGALLPQRGFQFCLSIAQALCSGVPLFEKSECPPFHGALQHVLPFYLDCFLTYFCI